MGVVPDSRLGKIEYYEAHIAPWTTNALAIGLTVPNVTLLSTATINARSAYNAHLAALEAAKAATQNFYDKVSDMHSAPGRGADMIKTIKAFAQASGNPNVYVLAQVPAPTVPGVVPPPGTPFDFAVSLLQSGALELKWKCVNPTGSVGTIYEVQRKIGSAAFAFIGGIGVKTFLDETLPTGSAPVTYKITGVRSTARGNPAQFTVNFGVGGQTVTIVEGESLKMAA